MAKLAKRFGNKKENVAVMVSKRANKLGISAEAALIILAKENDFGTSTYQRILDPSKQAEVRNALPSVMFPSAQPPARASGRKSKMHTIAVAKKNPFPEMIAYLIQDEQLRDRCRDNLLAKSHFDRAINQATLVLEDRIRKKSELGGMTGEPLVGKAFNADISKTLLRVSTMTLMTKEDSPTYCAALCQRFATKRTTTSQRNSRGRMRCVFARSSMCCCAW
jgi:hypothetical protein